MTPQEYKSQNPIEQYVEALGAKVVGSGTERITNVCPRVTHKPLHRCVNINTQKQQWFCNDCKIGGDLFRWIGEAEGKTDGDVLKSLGLGKENSTGVNHPKPPAKPSPPPTHASIEDRYEYQNQFGEFVYEVVRLIPKSFRQRHKDSAGNWVWNMEGVERVLYHLPQVMKAETVALCEGEKDAETLTLLGYCSTTNVGGASKWLDGYTETLAGKNVLIFGDNDDAGREHVKKVFDSIAGKAKSVKIIKIPEQFKDVTEYFESLPGIQEAKDAFASLVNSAFPFIKGVAMPLYTMAELESRYQKYTKSLATESFNLGQWLPSFNKIRRLVPGELVGIVGNTGVGKTGLLQSIALSALPLPTILFEIELPSELLFERFLSAKLGSQMRLTTAQFEDTYASGDALGEKVLNHHFGNLFICDDANLTVDTMEAMIVRSELKIGMKPKLVLVDYIQLLKASGEGRYDRASNAAESLKRIAKSTGTIIIFASQRQRPKDDEVEVSLHSAKESGSIENSVGLLLGAWREPEDLSLLHLHVLKSTKGGAGMHIQCNFDGEKMRITERSEHV